MSWVVFALLTACGSAGTSLTLKRTVALGDAVLSTIGFRLVGAVLLALVVTAAGAWQPATPAYWRTLTLLMIPEIGGMLFLTLALRGGDVSRVQPIAGLLPIFVTINGILFAHEIPTPLAALGIAFVTLGIYTVGLRRGHSLLEPLHALRRDRASWYAVLSSVFWSVTPFLHKRGGAEVGPLMWSMSVAAASGLVLALVFRLIHAPPSPSPALRGRWLTMVAITAVPFCVQVVTLLLALQRTQSGYVLALSSTSTLLATVAGVLLFGERGGAARIPGAAFVTAGAALIALGG
ncbi:MAG: EamA family transporter [Gemmatimonadaceae bacterium]|nr:EamA family transporter [Gemmatimonadaceae bacterium]